MRSRWLGWRFASAFTVFTVTLLTPVAITAASPAAAWAGTCQSWVGGQPPSPDASANQLNAVTVISPCDTWAVGSDGEGNMIEHWNGGSWKVVRSPQPAAGSFLDSVAAVSASNIWAVGGSFSGTGERDLILHWNGHQWTRVPCPSPGDSPRLAAVRAVSAKDAWAVGSAESKGTSRTITLHWNGRAWTQVKSPDPGMENNLYGLAAASASDAWAVGVFIKNDTDRTLILHWNGRTWSQVKSPNPGTLGVFLGSVDATSASNAWAVGEYTTNADRNRSLLLHWNGRTWTRAATPHPGGPRNEVLEGVDATSARDAWAVGNFTNDTGTRQTVVILHWNGSRWTAERGPRPGSELNELFSVSATSGSDVWAVGDFSDGGGLQNLAFHCC
jgi:hypothetical protein